MHALTATLTPAPFLAYLRLEVRRTLRNRRYVVFTIAFPVILYLLYTAVIPNPDNGLSVDGLRWPAYFLVSMAAYGALGAALGQAVPVATERRTGWARQLRVTPLPGFAYVAVKVLASMLVTLPALVLVAAAAVAVNHVQLGAGEAVAMVVVLVLASLPFATLGLLLGQLLDVESAQGGMVLTFFGLAILGGLFVPLPALPDTIATIGNVLPSSHFAALGRAALAGRVSDPVDVLTLVGWAVAFGAIAAWRYRRDAVAGR
jgi:ABC-2 type transport system permease protein